jgi:hypothetical protein
MQGYNESGPGVCSILVLSAEFVIRGLGPRIHLLRKSLSKWMDCRVKPGNDEARGSRPGRGAAFFMPLRRAGTPVKQASWTPALQRTASQVLRAALRPGHSYCNLTPP